MSGKATIGIIGGTGLGDALAQEAEGGETLTIDTPYGPPSGPLLVAQWEGVAVAFLSRHGPGHRFNPSNVPYRANIWAMKSIGVQTVIASGATGSLREDMEPGHLVLCDQVIDKTFRRDATFFDRDLVAHVELADPFCPRLRNVLAQAGEGAKATVHHAGTYVCMEGPQFSTRAESHMHRQWGGDLIGMTCMPESKLAREAELCYALVAFPTDYDCWRPVDTARPAAALLEEILANLRTGTEAALDLIRRAVRRLRANAPSDESVPECTCANALGMAMWTDRANVQPDTLKALRPLLARQLSAR